MVRRQAIGLLFGNLREAAVFAVLGKTDLIVDAFPVHPIGSFFSLAFRAAMKTL